VGGNFGVYLLDEVHTVSPLLPEIRDVTGPSLVRQGVVAKGNLLGLGHYSLPGIAVFDHEGNVAAVPSAADGEPAMARPALFFPFHTSDPTFAADATACAFG